MNLVTILIVSLFCLSLLIGGIAFFDISKTLSLLMFGVLIIIALSFTESFCGIDNPLNGQKATDIDETQPSIKKVKDLKIEEKKIGPDITEESKVHLEKLEKISK